MMSRLEKISSAESRLLRAGFVIRAIAAPTVLSNAVGNPVAETVGASFSDQIKKRLLAVDSFDEALKGPGGSQ